MRKGSVRRSAGKDLSSVISGSLARDHYHAVLEFGRNAYDADAEKFSLEISCLDDLLVMEDDGTGMDERGIGNFFRMGDSEKVGAPLTEKGRRKIGKFGIATVLLEYLGESYILETSKGMQKITVREAFEETRNGVRPNVEVMRLKKPQHGTRITVNGLKFTDRDFDIEKMRSVLEWEAPNIPDFKIYVNGILQKSRAGTEYSVEYAVSEDVDGVGRVEGSIYYNQGRVPTPGIFIYVFGSAVGDPGSFDGLFSGTMDGHVVGMINADGLDKEIGFDRTRFREDSKGYQGVREAIETVLKSMRTDLSRQASPSSRAYWQHHKKGNAVKDALHEAESRLNRTLGSKLKLEFVVDDKPSVSWIDKGVIYVNAAHPQMAVLKGSNQGRSLEGLFLTAAISAIADEEVGSTEDRLAVLESLRLEAHSVSQRVFHLMEPIGPIVRNFLSQDEGVAVRSADLALNAYRRYNLDDITDITGHNKNTVRYLYLVGALKPEIERQRGVVFRANEIMECMSRLDGYVPVGLLVDKGNYNKNMKYRLSNPEDPNGPPVKVFTSFEAISQDYGLLGVSTNSIIDVGTSEHPYLWVKKEDVKQDA